MKCEHNWDVGMEHLWLNGWGIYHLMSMVFMANGLGIDDLMGKAVMNFTSRFGLLY